MYQKTVSMTFIDHLPRNFFFIRESVLPLIQSLKGKPIFGLFVNIIFY